VSLYGYEYLPPAPRSRGALWPSFALARTVESASPGGITLTPGVAVLPETKYLARPRKKLPASAHLLTARRNGSFANHAPASYP